MRQSRHCVIVKKVVGHFVGHLFFVVISEFFDGLLDDTSLGSFKNADDFNRWNFGHMIVNSFAYDVSE